MKFNIWTFAFQVINFAVLLFILKRVLFRPVKEIMAKRRDLIAKTIGDAEKTKREAEEIRKKNQEEMDSIREMRTRMTETMRTEIAEERKKLLADAEAEAGKIIEKEKALFNMEITKARAELRNQAIEAVSLYVSRLFTDIADETLHDAVLRKAKDAINRIAAEIRDRNAGNKAVTIELASAYPVRDGDLAELRKALETGSGSSVELRAAIDRELIAGIRLKAYDMVYDLSLAGQARAFSTRLKEKV
jgi:F-type H+-transporting ATPase subunit b